MFCDMSAPDRLCSPSYLSYGQCNNQLEQAENCPIVTPYSNVDDCASSSGNENSRCWAKKSGSGACYETSCITESRTAVIKTNAGWRQCKVSKNRSNRLDYLLSSIVCEVLACYESTCQHIITIFLPHKQHRLGMNLLRALKYFARTFTRCAPNSDVSTPARDEAIAFGEKPMRPAIAMTEIRICLPRDVSLMVYRPHALSIPATMTLTSANELKIAGRLVNRGLSL